LEVEDGIMSHPLIFSTFVTFLAIVVQPFSGAYPMPSPSITIDIQPMDQEVNASAVNDTLVEYRVDVGVSKMPRQQVTVTLTAKIDTGWPITIDPDKLEFNDLSLDQWIVAKCCVTVPAGISYISAEFTVAGISTDGLNTGASSNATLFVKPFPPSAVNQTGNNTNSSGVPAPVDIKPASIGGNVGSSIWGLNNAMRIPVLMASLLLVAVAATGYGIVRIRRRKESNG
jgi:hypothetical protein